MMTPTPTPSSRRDEHSPQGENPTAGAEQERILQNRSSQIERYGRQAWEAEFVRLSEIQTLPGCPLRGPTLRAALWKMVPNSKFKRFQEAFSSEEELVIPKPRYENGALAFDATREDFRALSVRGTIVNPARLSAALVKSLQLESTQDGALAPEGIVQLKRLFDGAHPFQQTHLRLIAIEPTPAVLEKEYQRRGMKSVKEHDPATYGSVLLTKYSPSAPSGFFRPLTVQHFESIYGALRKSTHQSTGYTRENTKLGGFQAELEELSSTLRREWKREAPEDLKGMLRERSKEVVERILLELKGSSAAKKIEAKEYLQGIEGGVRDALGRENPQGAALKLLAATKRLAGRTGETRRKSSFNDTDQRMLEERIGRTEGIMKGFRERIEKNAPLLNDQDFLNRYRGNRSTRSDKEVKFILAQLGLHADDLLYVRLRPARTFARAMREEIAGLQTSLKTRDDTSAKQHLRHLQILSKLHSAVVGIEHLKGIAAKSDDIPVQATHRLATTLQNTLRTPHLFPGLAPKPEFKPLQDLLIRVVNKAGKMSDRLAQYGNRSLPPEEAQGLKERFITFLKGFSIEEAVRKPSLVNKSA